MQPLDDQLSRLLKSATEQTRSDRPPGDLSRPNEDAVIRAWRQAATAPSPGWFEGLLGPSVALAGAAVALAVALNYQSLSDLRDSSPTSELEGLIAESSTQLALLP